MLDMKVRFEEAARINSMWGRRFRFITFAGFVASLCWQHDSTAAPARHIDFNRDVRPILSESCFFCHGADANKRKAKLRLDVREIAIERGAIKPGDLNASELVSRIFSTNSEERMPPADSNRALSDQLRNTLREWIQQGAAYDTHWAFKAPSKSELPAVNKTKWSRNPIDRFILARLEQEKLVPSPEAPLDTLLRRVSSISSECRQRNSSLPLGSVSAIHLPPRWMSCWQARITVSAWPATGWMWRATADTHGFNNDSMRSMWRWRDWVIDAFNRNLPYDQFITEQLAGDLFDQPTLDQLIATGFNRNHVINSEGGIIDEEYRVEYVADRLQTTALAWMGLTVGCARCHDHKFDPVTQRDHYRLFAFFNNVDEQGEDGRVANASPIIPAPTVVQQKEMQQHRAAMQRAEERMKMLIAAQNWDGVRFDAPGVETNGAATNRIIALTFTVEDLQRGVFSNVAGGKPFRVVPTNTLSSASLADLTALVFDGRAQVKTEALPKFDSAKGWAFSAWVRRDQAQAAPLFSTMDFHVPASSQGYGQGVKVRLTARGSVEVRIARRWPAYSASMVTREHLATGEWHQVIVACDRGTSAKAVRMFLDGQECFRDVVHDDLTGSVGISGAALIGGSEEQGTSGFIGALAEVSLFSNPVHGDQLGASSRDDVLRVAMKHPSAAATNLQRAAWLEMNNAEFARSAKERRMERAALLAIGRDAPTTWSARRHVGHLGW